MRTSEGRDVIVARVNAAFDAHRTVDSWPVTTKWDIQAPVEAPGGQKEYVAALYVLCASGVPVGRLPDGSALVGTRHDAEIAEPPQGIVVKAQAGK